MSELKNLYTELSVISNFSFLEGGSHPEELVETAISLGYQTISLADKHTLSGVVRFHIAAKNLGIKGIIGSRIVLTPAKIIDPKIAQPAEIKAS